MRLSTRGRYAVRAMVDLAMHSQGEPVLREDIASRQGISAPYLAQLFARLAKAGLVDSVKGPGGGYLLARDADRISSGDIVRAVEGSLAPVFCLDTSEAETCKRVDTCVTHLLWKQVGEGIEEVLDGVTLHDLRMQASELQKAAQTAQQQPA